MEKACYRVYRVRPGIWVLSCRYHTTREETNSAASAWAMIPRHHQFWCGELTLRRGDL